MKRLSEICKRLIIKETNVIEDYEIFGIETDSRKIRKGYLFVVTEGNEKYLDDAFRRGAVCVMAEKAYSVPCIKVDNVRESLSLSCSDFYDNPERKVKIVGVVGTNGKTSITHILYELFKPYKKVGIIGTLGIVIGEERSDNPLTTPDPPLLFKILREAVEKGIEYLFCEISAHAIYFKKFYSIRCEICIFTNLTQDHLDFFVSMEKYAEVKRSYFDKNNMKIGVINVDDETGYEILKSSNICSVSYGINQPSDVFGIDVNCENGVKFIANAFDDIIYVSTRFEGRFNVYNILACIAVARLVGISPKDIQSRLKMLSPIEGRADCVWSSPKVVIDYAHTPDGLKNILGSLKETTNGKLIAVFGCGGNRDKLKRPIMANIGTDIADVCVFTSDNPRFENPDDIIKDMLRGVEGKQNYITIPDRTCAIQFAIRLANDDDCVVVCGKGGEAYMEIKGEKYPYSDKRVCLTVLESKNCQI